MNKLPITISTWSARRHRKKYTEIKDEVPFMMIVFLEFKSKLYAVFDCTCTYSCNFCTRRFKRISFIRGISWLRKHKMDLVSSAEVRIGCGLFPNQWRYKQDQQQSGHLLWAISNLISYSYVLTNTKPWRRGVMDIRKCIRLILTV